MNHPFSYEIYQTHPDGSGISAAIAVRWPGPSLCCLSRWPVKGAIAEWVSPTQQHPNVLGLHLRVGQLGSSSHFWGVQDSPSGACELNIKFGNPFQICQWHMDVYGHIWHAGISACNHDTFGNAGTVQTVCPLVSFQPIKGPKEIKEWFFCLSWRLCLISTIITIDVCSQSWPHHTYSVAWSHVYKFDSLD